MVTPAAWTSIAATSFELFFLPEGLSERVVGVGAAIKVVGLEQQHDWARRGGDHASGVTVACVTGMSLGSKGRDWLQG